MPNPPVSAALENPWRSSQTLPGHRPVLRDLLADFEKSLILAALTAAGGNQKRAAQALGVLPTTFQEKLKRLGLPRPRTQARSLPQEMEKQDQ